MAPWTIQLHKRVRVTTHNRNLKPPILDNTLFSGFKLYIYIHGKRIWHLLSCVSSQKRETQRNHEKATITVVKFWATSNNQQNIQQTAANRKVSRESDSPLNIYLLATCATAYDKTTVNNLKAKSTPQKNVSTYVLSNRIHHTCASGHVLAAIKFDTTLFVSLQTTSLLGQPRQARP